MPHVIEAVYPGWKLIGYRVRAGSRSAYFSFIAPQEDRVLLGFEYGTLLTDPHHLLIDSGGKQVRHVTISRARDIRPSPLAVLITQAAHVALAPKAEKARILLERE